MLNANGTFIIIQNNRSIVSFMSTDNSRSIFFRHETQSQSECVCQSAADFFCNLNASFNIKKYNND